LESFAALESDSALCIFAGNILVIEADPYGARSVSGTRRAALPTRMIDALAWFSIFFLHCNRIGPAQVNALAFRHKVRMRI
jgi:hypothetical protein